ncbi:MAG: thioredoxin domain-containing protein, partial [Planctomycetes bacterium]|nr:thioredoxin domain-containing protein [Planctomycetota bacterium]
MASSPPPAGSPSTVPAHATDGARHTNRLINETSPYLLQHAHNPVDWYPWGEEAFEAARRQDKAIFVSIGYSTCYWCHVMERESFENEQIAALMNEHFICIKVDREERPDVDDIYMAATQALNQGQGGWPMSIFLEPEALRPFMAGTYFPPEDRHGRAGFPRVLTQMAGVWAGQREAVVRQAEQVAALVKRNLSRAAAPRPRG